MALALDWVKDLQFVASDDAGHGVVIESRREGASSGFTPMQLLLVAAAGCMAMDVVSILGKKRLPLRGFKVEMEGVRSDEHPKRFTKMRFVYTATGEIPQADLDEAIRLSEEKYCSVSATLKNAPRMVIESRVAPE
jgi:putative redox protein